MTQTIHIEEWDYRTVKHMVQFLTTEDYDVEDDMNPDDDEGDSQSKDDVGDVGPVKDTAPITSDDGDGEVDENQRTAVPGKLPNIHKQSKTYSPCS